MLAGRLISFTALLGLIALSWRIIMLYTADRYCAWLAAILTGSTALFLTWGTTGQVDTMAVFWSMLAFYFYSRHAIRGDATLVLAGLCIVISFFTKQTMLACPAAIFIMLWADRGPKKAMTFGAGVGAVVLALVLGINIALHGRFLDDTLRANLNPFAFDKLGPHVQYMKIAAGQLILIVALGARRAWPQAKALFVYLGLAFAVLALTAPKIGSDANYQIETTLLLILCACAALHALEFFPLTFRGSKSWITLLVIPVAVHLVLNIRITKHVVLTRVVQEQVFREQVAALKPFLADGARLLSADYNSTERLRGELEVEPLIYHLLVRGGAVDPEPLRRDIAAEAFSTVVLYDDFDHPDPGRDIEISRLPRSQMEEIHRHYKLVAHIPGPYVDGLFVYKPRGTQK